MFEPKVKQFYDNFIVWLLSNLHLKLSGIISKLKRNTLQQLHFGNVQIELLKFKRYKSDNTIKAIEVMIWEGLKVNARKYKHYKLLNCKFYREAIVYHLE